MNKTKRIAFGIGIVLAVLAVLIAPAAADSEVYFAPDPSTVSVAPGENVTIQIMADIGNVDPSETGIRYYQIGVDFDPSVVNITSVTNPWIFEPYVTWWMQAFAWDNPSDEDPGPIGAWIWTTGAHNSCYGAPTTVQVANLTIEGVSGGTSPLNFTRGVRLEPTRGDSRLFNCTTKRITPITWVNGTIECTGPLKPDLNVTAKSETLDDGTFTVTYTVANIGGGDAAASTTAITTTAGGSATDSVPALAPGESHTGTVSGFNCPCGTTVTVTVCADDENVIDESDEDNNCMSNDLACHPCPKPDLNVTAKSETLDDGTFTVTYTVANIGGGDAAASTTAITTSDGQSASGSVPALAPGESHTGTVSGFNCPCGTTVTVTVCADDENVIDESDEDNNCLSNELTCQPCGLPDLELTDIWCTNGSKPNTYDIFYNITNNGAVNAPRSTSNLTIDGGRMKRDSVKPLAAGETRTESFLYRSKTAPSTIKVCADFKDRIAESDETNNCMEKTVTCT